MFVNKISSNSSTIMNFNRLQLINLGTSIKNWDILISLFVMKNQIGEQCQLRLLGMQ